MGTIYDTLQSLNGHINLLNKKYNENGTVREITPPQFVILSISRAADTAKDINDIYEDPEKETHIVLATQMTDKEDPFNPVYVCVVDNIKHAIVDQIPIHSNHNDQSGYGIALIINIPKKLFMRDTSFEDAAKELFIIYSKVLETDPNMKYVLDLSMINYSENKVNPVPLYDLTMAYMALGCVHINLVSWYRENTKKIKGESTLDAIFGDEINEDMKMNIASTLDNNCTKIGKLRDSIAAGTLILDALYVR